MIFFYKFLVTHWRLLNEFRFPLADQFAEWMLLHTELLHSWCCRDMVMMGMLVVAVVVVVVVAAAVVDSVFYYRSSLVTLLPIVCVRFVIVSTHIIDQGFIAVPDTNVRVVRAIFSLVLVELVFRRFF